MEHMVSIYRDNSLRTPLGLWQVDDETGELLVTFEGLITRTPFVKQIKAVLQVLEETIGVPVDVEFATTDNTSICCSVVPRAIPPPALRHRYRRVCRGIRSSSPPKAYHQRLDSERHTHRLRRSAAVRQPAGPHGYVRVGRAVSHLNKVLPKRQFILMARDGGAVAATSNWA